MELTQVKVALSSLHLTGVLRMQREELSNRLLDGSDSEDPTELVQRILDVRRTNHFLLSLEQQGEEFSKELKND